MGRLMGETRSHPEAVKRCRDMQFGCVGRGCKDLMLKMIKQEAGFNHADQFIDDPMTKLVLRGHLVFDTAQRMFTLQLVKICTRYQ
jgi:hypothetical protein